MEHFTLLAIHYGVEQPNEAHWQTMIHHTSRLHQLIMHLIKESAPLPGFYAEIIQRLIISHWQLWQTHGGAEPPAYLVDAIDYVERNYPTWFSYERSGWMEG